MLSFLSWDCGNKTLAHAHIIINSKILIEIRKIYSRFDSWHDRYIAPNGPPEFTDKTAIVEILKIIDDARRVMSTFILFISVGVNDILEGKKVADTDEVQRTVALHKFLVQSPASLETIFAKDKIYSTHTQVLIEHQPSKVGTATNNKSTMIGHQLAFYYVERPVFLIDPKLKNKLTIAPGMEFSPTYGGAYSKYAARKKHSKDTFLKLLGVLGLEHVTMGIPLSCMDDLADATLQIIAYCKDRRLFVC